MSDHRRCAANPDMLAVAAPGPARRHTVFQLRARLEREDPITAPAGPDLIATVLAYLHTGDGNAETRLLWARWANTAAPRLYGRASLPTLQTNQIYQSVLAGQGLHVDAATVCRQRLTGYRERGDRDLELTTWISLVDALQDSGQCDWARHELAGLMRAGHRRPSEVRQSRQIMLTRVVLAAGCGQPGQAARILKEHAAELAGVDEAGLEAIAQWLAATVTVHPEVCERRDTGGASAADVEFRQRVWRLLLHRSTHEGPLVGGQVVPR